MKTTSLLLSLVLAPLALADLDLTLAAEIRLGRAAPPPPPEVVVVEEPVHSGPPPWAPAHGFRRNRAYYYYPGTDVYYRPADRTWIYLDGGDWRVGVSLPASLRVDFDRAVSLTMETDKPYEFHDSVRERYPSAYFSTHVRVKEKSGPAGKAERGSDPAPKTEPGNGHDRGASEKKGKGKKKDK